MRRPFLSALLLAGALGLAAAEDLDTTFLPKPRVYPPVSEILPAGRLVDWSRTGYKEGDEDPPLPPAKYDVRRFGAKGDGKADDTAALEFALAAANAVPGVVHLPAGTYRLSRPLTITAGGVVLRGDGEGATKLLVTRSLSDVHPGSWRRDDEGKVTTQWADAGGFVQIKGRPEGSARGDTRLAGVAGRVERLATRLPVDSTAGLAAGQWVRVYAAPQDASPELQLSAKVAGVGADYIDLDRPLPFPVDAGRGSVHRYAPSVQGSGVEQLTIEFLPLPYGGHAEDRGFNALALANAADVWVRAVTVLNADNALLLQRVDHASLLDVTVDTTASRADAADSEQRQGHHAIRLAACHSVLVARFSLRVRYYHDLAAASGALQNTFTAGDALDLALHSEAGPLANLYSDIQGAGARLFTSPGSGAAGWATTLYNLRRAGVAPLAAGAAPGAAPPLQLPACEAGQELNVYCAGTAGGACPGWLVVPTNASLPADIYSELKYARTLSTPMPEGAHRAVPGAAFTACRTYMGQADDPMECWDLAYDHCIPGYTNRNAIPRPILEHEQQVLDDLFNAASPDGSFGSPPNHPRRYSRVCTANPQRAGKGRCGHVRVGQYRIHTRGFWPSYHQSECDNTSGKTSFVKAHVDPDHQYTVRGRVGH